MKGDFTKNTFRPEKGYSSVRMQQGRVQLDADWNEQIDIQAHRQETALRDIIGGCCVPASEPESFRVSEGGSGLTVAPGRIYVDGVLCQASEEQSLALPEESGTYAVYLEVWQRHLTAIEDPEIREVALGGPDTATRTQTTCRPHLQRAGENDTCYSAFSVQGNTDGTLTARTAPEAQSTPCTVPGSAGYTRLEPQLYRVEVHTSGDTTAGDPPTFKWSRDNGSIVTEWLETDGDELIVADLGRDDVLGFHDNRWIELGHDELDLSGEAGILVEIIERTPEESGRYRLRIDAHGQTVPDVATLGHPKIRRWDQDAGSNPITGDLDIVAGASVDLEGGIQIQFSDGFYRSGDYWLIPARTFVGDFIGDIEWPRDAAGTHLPQPPLGVERQTCRLAIVTVDDGEVIGEPQDCRNLFPSLCGLETAGGGTGCCTVTVGDGPDDFNTIRQALEVLGDGGGTVCIRPGEYRERIVLNDPRNLTLHGCGPDTRIIAPDGQGPVLQVNNGRDITIHSLSIVAADVRGLSMTGPDLADVTLRNLEVASDRRSAIHVQFVSGLTLEECRIRGRMLREHTTPETERVPLVFLQGSDLRILGNAIEVDPTAARFGVRIPAGGLQLGGGTERARLENNLIQGGAGNGITLGSVSRNVSLNFNEIYGNIYSAHTAPTPDDIFEADGIAEAVRFYAVSQPQPEPIRGILDEAGNFVLGPPPTEANAVASDGNLTDITLSRNTISGMGSNGISVAHFFELQEATGDFISIRGLDIHGNLIDGCMSHRHVQQSEALLRDAAYGGITLADATDLQIRGNTVRNIGNTFPNAICGIFLLHGKAVDICGNQIVHVGIAPQNDPSALPPGRRGGIVIGLAQVKTRTVEVLQKNQLTGERQDGTPAARIHDNVVVANEGRALEVVALGPVSIHGNQFTAIGANFQNQPDSGIDPELEGTMLVFADALGGAVVWVLNLGVSNELYLQFAGFAGLGNRDFLSQPEGDATDERLVLANGNILFNDNQIVLDAVNQAQTIAFSQTALLCLDDVSCHGNQSDCDLFVDLAGTNFLIWGFSVRCNDNRLKEGALNAFLSAMTVGFMNSTTDNQGTHCFLRVGRRLPENDENAVLFDFIRDNPCADFEELGQSLSAKLFGGQ